MARIGLNIPISADASGVRKGTKEAEGYVDKFHSKATGQFHEAKHSALGFAAGLIGGAGVVEALKSTVETANAAEVAQRQLQTQLKAQGISWATNRDEIEKTIRSTSELSGLTDKDLTGAFTNLVRATGNVKQSMGLLTTAADIARAKHLDVSKAAQLLGKVADGNVGALGRYGVVIQKGATAQEALAAVQAKFSGQAQAYGKTTSGALDRVHASSERLQEVVGQRLAPHLADAAGKLADFIDQMSSGTGAGGQFASAVGDVVRPLGKVVGFLKDHPKILRDAVAAWAAYKVASFIALNAVKANDFRKIFARSIPVAGEEGAAAGTAFTAGFDATGSAGVGRLGKSGRLLGAFRSIGSVFGIAMAAQIDQDLQTQISRAIQSLPNGIGHLGPIDFSFPLTGGGGSVTTAGQIAAGHPQPGQNFVTGGNEGGITTTSRKGRTKGGLPLPTGSTGTIPRAPDVPGSVPDMTTQFIGYPGKGKGGGGSGGGGGGGTSRQSLLDSLRHKTHYSHTDLMELWVLAGGPPGVADTAAAIAQAESGGNPGAGANHPYHGLWQVGPGGSFDPWTNAQQAVGKYRGAPGGGNNFSPWTTYTGYDTGPGGSHGAKTYLRFLTGQTISGGSGGVTGTGSAGAGFVNPLNRTKSIIGLHQQAAKKQNATNAAAVLAYLNGGQGAVSEAQAYTEAVTADPSISGAPAGFAIGMAKTGEIMAIRRRLARVRKLLKSATGPKRTALLQEFSTLTGRIGELTAPIDTGAGTADAAGDPNQALIDALNANTDAEKAHAAELAALKDQVKRGNDLTDQIRNVDTTQLKQALADAVSGSIGGPLMRGLGTPAYAGGRMAYAPSAL